MRKASDLPEVNFLLRARGARDRHRHHSSASVIGRDGQAPATHDFKSFLNVLKRDMRLAVVSMLVPDVYFSLDEQFDGDRVAVKKGEYQLMYFINGVIDEVLESGQYEEWFEEYGQLWEKIGK